MNDKGIEIDLDQDANTAWVHLAGVLFAVALVVLAVALWTASIGLAVMFGAFGIGMGGYNLLRGLAYVVLASGRRDAMIIEAQGRAAAEQTRAKAELVDSRRPPYRLIE